MRYKITGIFLAIILITFNCSDASNQEQQAALPFPVFLNHVYVTTDAETYESIVNSSFLREQFAVSELRTTVRRGGRSYTGLYFYGENTYFEIFNADTEERFELGYTGIAFGVEQPNSINTLRELISDEDGELSPAIRILNGQQIPWFYSVGPKDFPENTGLFTWIMEYHPEFLSQWHPESNENDIGISRNQFLNRYVSVLQDIPAEPAMLDITSITIAAGEKALAGMLEMCNVFGYTSSFSGKMTIIEGPDIALKFIPETESKKGIQQITLKIKSGSQQQSEYRFGSRSTLKINDDGTATWSF